MRLDLDNQLRLRHRKIFLDPDPPDRLAALAFELQVDDGWYTLLDVLCTDLQRETDIEGAPQVKATQVKEKFGRLRFRLREASDRQRAMIYLAESLSERTCAVCGAPADDLAVWEQMPRCMTHFPIDMPEQKRTILPRWFSAMATRCQEWRQRGNRMQATMVGRKLNQAIRDGDAVAAREALDDGACLDSCTLDDDGYHTPLELASQQQVKNWTLLEELFRRR
jgi:hypothetical protein